MPAGHTTTENGVEMRQGTCIAKGSTKNWLQYT